MARKRRTQRTATEMLFVQLYIATNGERVPVDIWREVHKKKLERKDSIAVKRFLGRPESIALLERLGATIRPARGELEKREQREVATSRSSSNYGPSARKLNRRASFEQAVCDPS